MRSNDELRALWGPGCLKRQDAAEVWYDGRKFLVHPLTIDAWAALFDVMERWHYSIDGGTLDDWSLYCRPITGGTKLSMHSFGTAVDINSITNPYGPRLVTDMPSGMVAEIKAIRTRNGAPVFRWGGDYTRNKDAMHYEVVASPNEIRSGIAGDHHPPRPTPEDEMNADQEAKLDRALDQLESIKSTVRNQDKELAALRLKAERSDRFVIGTLVAQGDIDPKNVPFELRKHAKDINKNYPDEGYDSLLQGSG